VSWSLRPARPGEAERVAAMHRAGIPTGFLSGLDPRLLARLYRRVVADPGSFLVVACDPSDSPVGFLAGTADVRRLYAGFLLRHGVGAAWLARGTLASGAKKAVETMRHGLRPAGRPGWPRAELLAMAVEPGWRRQGVGAALVQEFFGQLSVRQAASAKVVVGAANPGAEALYVAAGFRPAGDYQLHRGEDSRVLTWP
jgi:ribosomal protein S18 acetylase RimI-like enzyme